MQERCGIMSPFMCVAPARSASANAQHLRFSVWALGASIAAGGSRLNYSRSRHKNLTDIMMRFLGEEGQARLAALYSAGRAGPSSEWPGLDA